MAVMRTPPFVEDGGMPNRVFDIGNNQPEDLRRFSAAIEGWLGVKAEIKREHEVDTGWERFGNDADAHMTRKKIIHVAGALLSELRLARAADGPCVSGDVTGTIWTDPIATPNDGFYYVVRAVNACGPPTMERWGLDSLDAERPACP